MFIQLFIFGLKARGWPPHSTIDNAKLRGESRTPHRKGQKWNRKIASGLGIERRSQKGNRMAQIWPSN